MTINILAILQIVVSVFLVTGVLLQQRGSAIGSAFGQEGGAFYGSRRGMEKKIFWATVTLGALFVILAILNLIF
ncbi:preprotein translocase subunit SecG [Patescibacteria group bacterium]|nr:preprotein translocase subunit SecG [Patescibacteria group bacterium]MBU1046038.1 preprotein translocase subunit SecG [Patescibacteria group bacterium]